ncbi:MAG: hypothetical protein R3C14_40540 [Caldilineaceae bacterium]
MLDYQLTADPAFVYWAARVADHGQAAFGVPLPYRMAQPWLDWYESGWSPEQAIMALSTTEQEQSIGAEWLITVPRPINLFCKTGV